MKKPTRLLRRAAAAFVVFIACGIYDVTRNKEIEPSVVKKYFIGNGALTWLLSPFNILMDILALPYINKGIYRLEDLPQSHQDEIQRLIDAAHRENLVSKLEELTRDHLRTMIFFKWYGANLSSSIDIPAFHENYRYIKTIGVSVFNKKESTSKHFGPLRATLRVLYNINNMEDHSAYIAVGTVKNYWREHKLFIFDDTLLHQSFNESDQARYCLFVDILRPAVLVGPLSLVVSCARLVLKGINQLFYNNWKVIK